MTPSDFLRQLRAISLENVFNPYTDRCPVHDVEDASDIRTFQLKCIVELAADRGTDAIWIGRDLGYRGGRRTGLALTDDVHLEDHSRRWGFGARRPTMGDLIRERTAAVIWAELRELDQTIFLWNVFPFHPHEVGNPLSNRSHRGHERRIGEEILWELLKLLRPRCVVAIGNDAAQTMSGSGISVVQVRHPSYGGQAIFSRQIRELYGRPSFTHAARH